MKTKGASPARLLEMLSDRFGALEAVAHSSIKLSRYVSEAVLRRRLMVPRRGCGAPAGPGVFSAGKPDARRESGPRVRRMSVRSEVMAIRAGSPLLREMVR